MKASVIVLAWNGVEYLKGCLEAVLAQDYPDFEGIVVDNGSTDGSADFVAERYPKLHLIRNARNLGFAGGNNVGLRAATGEVLVLLNQDTVVHAGWLRALVTALEDPSVGIVGCKLLYPDGTLQHAGGYLQGSRGESKHIGRHEPDAGQHDQPCDVDFVTGAAVAMRRPTLVRVGPLDEGFAPAYHEDIDWCYRVREAGLRVVYWPAAVLTHYESTSAHVNSHAHKAVYHYGRLRLLFKHKPLAWLQQTFAPAEMGWSGQLGRTAEMMATRDAYLHLMLSLPEILAFRAQMSENTPGQTLLAEGEALLRLTAGLRAVCVEDDPLEALTTQLEYTEEHALGTRLLEKSASVKPPEPASTDATPATEPVEPAEAEPAPGAPSLELPAALGAEQLVVDQLWSKLQARWEIKEQPFQSQVPVLGKSVAAFRQAWNDVSTRWYVLPMIQQQVEFNGAAMNLISALARHQANQQNHLALTQIAMLHMMKQMLDTIEGQRRDIAQTIREVDTLATLIPILQQRLERLEDLLKEKNEQGSDPKASQ